MNPLVLSAAGFVLLKAAAIIRKRHKDDRVWVKPQRHFKVFKATTDDAPYQHLERPHVAAPPAEPEPRTKHSVPENHPYYPEIHELLLTLAPSLAEATPLRTNHASTQPSTSASGVGLSSWQPPTASLLNQVLTHRGLDAAARHEESDVACTSDACGPLTPHLAHTHLRPAFSPGTGTPADGRSPLPLPHAPGWQLPMPEPRWPPPLELTPLIMVRSRQQLQELREALLKVPEFAVDVEHHAARAYLGVTCTIQVSTGDVDYVVDAIALHDHLGDALRPVFSNPHIVKVLHGCANDVLWLQRDFHLYLVNVFDTEKAALVLSKSGRSLAALLQLYCNFNPDKTYQTADWTQRPLSPEMCQYARTDVHFLLYVAACLRQELCAASPSDTAASASESTAQTSAFAHLIPHPPGTVLPVPLAQTLLASQRLTGQLYTKTTQASAVHTAASHLLRRAVASGAVPSVSKGFIDALTQGTHMQHGSADAPGSASEQAALARLVALYNRLMAVCLWRDQQARKDDEGLQYILPDAVLLGLTLAAPTSHKACKDVLLLHAGGPPELAGISPAAFTQSKQLVKLMTDATNAPTPYSHHTLASSAQHLPATTTAQLPALAGATQPLTTTCSASAVSVAMLMEKTGMVASTAAPTLTGPNSTLRQLGLPAGSAAGSVDAVLASAGAPGVPAPGAMPRARKHGGLSSLPLEKQAAIIKKFASKGAVYENCVMLSQDGELLCHCDRRKLEWYVAKGLAERVSQEPPTIRLAFEHKNTDQAAGVQFYTQTKVNRCVVCGDEQNYLRYRVVPSCYRRKFPVHLKSHRSHDVVLLCVKCHQMAHQAAEKEKRAVAQSYGIPLTPPRDTVLVVPAELPHHGVGGQGSAETAASASSAQPDGGPAGSVLDGSNGTVRNAGVGAASLGSPAADMAQGDESRAGGDTSAGGWGVSGSSGTDTDDEGDDEAEEGGQADGGGSQEENSEGGDAPGHTRSKVGEGAASVGSSFRSVRTTCSLGDEDSGRVEAGGAKAGGGHKRLSAGVGAARRAAVALRQYGTGMPPSRIAQLEAVIKHALGRDPATDPPSASGSHTRGCADGAPFGLRQGDIEAAMVVGLGSRKRNQLLSRLPPDLRAAATATVAGAVAAGSHGADGNGHLWHGERVVAAALAAGGEEQLHALVRRFREAFVRHCQPRFLPPSWDVDHSATREYGDFSIYTPSDKRRSPQPVATTATAATVHVAADASCAGVQATAVSDAQQNCVLTHAHAS